MHKITLELKWKKMKPFFSGAHIDFGLHKRHRPPMSHHTDIKPVTHQWDIHIFKHTYDLILIDYHYQIVTYAFGQRRRRRRWPDSVPFVYDQRYMAPVIFNGNTLVSKRKAYFFKLHLYLLELMEKNLLPPLIRAMKLIEIHLQMVCYLNES